MSRSNPTDGIPNPAVRWFEWNGEAGTVRYYDKDTKRNVDVGSEFTFILLDQLGSVRGWHDPSSSGIYSNEVRDTTQDVLIVKAFKGGTLAEGIYRDIKDKVHAAGGKFVANCYIAFKNGGPLTIGSIRFKGGALNAWVEFTKANRADLYKQAIEIKGYTEGKKGRVVYRVPALKLAALSPESNDAAVKLDEQLQEFLTSYLKRTRRDQVEHVAHDTPADDYADEPQRYIEAPDEESIPF